MIQGGFHGMIGAISERFSDGQIRLVVAPV
jgi:hypothetical protein